MNIICNKYIAKSQKNTKTEGKPKRNRKKTERRRVNLGVIISIVNQKGGVAKTTTAINLAAAIGQKGKKVLLVDLDPQGNASTGIGVNKRELKYTTYDVIMGDIRPEEAVISTNFKNVWIIPATQTLAEGEIRLTRIKNKTLQLKSPFADKGQVRYYIGGLPALAGSVGASRHNRLRQNDNSHAVRALQLRGSSRAFKQRKAS